MTRFRCGLVIVLDLLMPLPALAQLPPSQWSQDYVPTLGDWQAAFASRLPLITSPDTQYQNGGLTNGAVISAAGNLISYCPTLSCVVYPSADHQRTSALFWSTTQDDGHSEEQTVGIETTVATGYAKTWAPSTSFSVGDNVRTNGEVYRATAAGTSAASGSGPAGTASSIPDGTVTWMWINQTAIDAKVGLYDEEAVVPGGGNSWAQANNVQLQSGMIPSFNINTEMDLTNNSGTDCVVGAANCNDLEMEVGGANSNTTGIHLSSSNSGTKYGAIWGIRLNGAKLASQADIEDDAAAPVGLGFNYSTFGSGGHSMADFWKNDAGLVAIQMGGAKTSSDIADASASPAGFANSGTHALGTINDSSNSPTVLAASGSHAGATIADTSTTPAAVNASGAYSYAAFSSAAATTPVALSAKKGQAVCLNGTLDCLSEDANGKVVLVVAGVRVFSIAQDGTPTFIKTPVVGSP